MIIIPMAGLSSRFFKAGFKEPKYKLIAHDRSLFEWSVKTFEKYYQTEKFLFICRNVFETPQFIEKEVKKIGIKDFEISVLSNETRGQAETIYLNLHKISPDENILIFNIDTYRHNFEFYNLDCDAYLEVFKGDGEHWSFVLPRKNTDSVLKTTEKKRISDLCSNGVYFFKNLIKDEYDVRYKLVEINKHIFMGTPTEYELFLKNNIFL